jgi:hypothetical protein
MEFWQDVASRRAEEYHVQGGDAPFLFMPNSGQLIYQKSPPEKSATGGEHLRSFTHSLQSYDLAGKKEFTLLMRNFEYTQEYPTHHVIINFYKQMPLGDFSKMKSKAFEYLKRWDVRGYYVLEPFRCRDWIHIHLLAIYGGRIKMLRAFVKYAFTLAGLTYGQDFRVKVLPAGATEKDYVQLCCYILKFNGKRKTNRHEPKLFIKGLGLRKVGSFGKWFAKTKKKLWQEYREELRRKHEEIGQDDSEGDIRIITHMEEMEF